MALAADSALEFSLVTPWVPQIAWDQVVTLLDVVELFEDISARPAEGAERENATGEGRAITRVLEEINQTARAVLGSITLATMLKIVERERREPRR